MLIPARLLASPPSSLALLAMNIFYNYWCALSLDSHCR